MLKLHAGVSKKVGLPGFSSASASCTIEAELDSSLLNDGDGFQVVVKRAYQSCEKAVQDQIARLTGTGTHDSEPGIRERQAQPVAHEIIDVQTVIRRFKTGHASAPENRPPGGGYWVEESSSSDLRARGFGSVRTVCAGLPVGGGIAAA